MAGGLRQALTEAYSSQSRGKEAILSYHCDRHTTTLTHTHTRPRQLASRAAITEGRYPYSISLFQNTYYTRPCVRGSDAKSTSGRQSASEDPNA